MGGCNAVASMHLFLICLWLSEPLQSQGQGPVPVCILLLVFASGSPASRSSAFHSPQEFSRSLFLGAVTTCRSVYFRPELGAPESRDGGKGRQEQAWRGGKAKTGQGSPCPPCAFK